MRIACPFCGERGNEEFAYLGDATVVRPDPGAAGATQAFADYLYLRNNVRGLHRELWVHAAENFFTAFRIHGCQLAHQFVARSPFSILAPTDADRQKHGNDPNSDICSGHERNKEAKHASDKPTAVIQPAATRVFYSRHVWCKRTEQEIGE